jgi:DNA-directed RNA polymerase subunit RPC12/RpoP
MVQKTRPVDPLSQAGDLFLLVSTCMSNAPAQAIVCPHCKKTFDGELLAEGSRHEGFKCPHCRLFVPAERANGDDGAPSKSPGSPSFKG